MKYTISYKEPSKQYIDISFETDCKKDDSLLVQLAAWRPGRYELGNFAKNIQRFKVYDEKGNELPFKKLNKDSWEIQTAKAKSIRIDYNYYAAVLNAGSTYLDANQLYVNPVNCCVFLPSRPFEACELVLNIPKAYQVATGLKENGVKQFLAKNFDELADCPFIASRNLKKLEYQVDDYRFFLWFQGEVKLDEARLIKDFSAFTKAQIDLFGDFPCSEYHFLFQILPQSAYHGVEHSNSTVIVLGPSYAVMDKAKRYEDLLGVSSHELFHTWNVKRIRPAEMWPYDFSKENYSRLGYLAEGATTWYGDEMLKRSAVFDDKAYFKTIAQLLERHFNNPGVENMSVADSSFDTWLDGYVPGVPNRKASIYTEGALITLMLDYIIKKESLAKYSFDDVMRSFYEDYYKKDKGIAEADYKKVVEKYAGKDLTDFFNRYVNGAENIEQLLQEAMKFLGYEYERKPAENYHEAYWGFRNVDNKVYSIYPGSPAEKAGLQIGDEIVSVNRYAVKQDLADWAKYFNRENVELSVIDAQGMLKFIRIKASKKFYYSRFEVRRIS